ncbi:MAG: type VI secretion system baseplate subunit TssG [Desulfobacteria bacterium]
MAGPDRKSALDLKLDLLKQGHGFSFFQALRLLRRVGGAGEESPGEKEGADRTLRIRPDLSLGFPASDVARIEETPGGPAGYRVTVSFLGLYGASSPLPTFYTEDLIDEQLSDSTTTRDFLDIFHHRLYLLLFRCWSKYRQLVKVVEEESPEDLEKLFCLMGLGEPELRNVAGGPYGLLRYIGLFTQHPRSAAGLEGLLQDVIGGPSVELIPCLLRKARIPPDQRAVLGESGRRLGEDCFLGDEIDDRMGKFRLRIGPLDANRFDSLLPGRPAHRRVAAMVGLYLTDPLEYDIELVLSRGEAKTVCLGAQRWSALGLDTWSFTGDMLAESGVTFPPQPLSEVA